MTCAACGVGACLTVAMVDDTFVHGVGDAAVRLTTRIPAYSCGSCGMQYTNWIAEEARARAVLDLQNNSK